MKSKKPFLSRELIYNNLRRFWWIAALYTLGLFLVSPLVVLTNGSDTIPKSGYNIYFSDIYEGSAFFLFVVPVFIAIMVFRYMQNPKSMVLLHSMPYTRLRLYVNNIISGLILLLLPILLNSAFLSVIQIDNLGGTYFKEGIVLRYLYTSCLVGITLYIWTVFVGMFTGSSIAQTVFTYILNFLFAGLIAVIQYLLRGVLYGFTMNEEICTKALEISPLYQGVMLAQNSITQDNLFTKFLIIDIIISVILLVVGYYVYKYRNLESAGDVISGKYIKPLFKYGVTTCAMLAGAMYVKEIFSLDSLNIFIYLLFALIGYIIAEMLLKKSFKIWKSYKGFLAFSLVFIIVAIGVKMDMFGYEKYIPAVTQIKAASITGSPDFKNSTEKKPSYGILYQEENVKNVIAMHNKFIEDKNINLSSEEDRYNKRYFPISYELIDGRVIKREYYVSEDKYEELYNKIYDSAEYKISTNNIFDYEVSDIYSVRISNNLIRDDNYIVVADKNEIANLFEAVKNDIIDMTVKEAEQYRNVYRVEFIVKKKNDELKETISYRYGEQVIEDSAGMVRESFNINAENLVKFLEARGYKQALESADSVTRLRIFKYDENESTIITEKDKIAKVINYFMYTPIVKPTSSKEYYTEIEVVSESGASNYLSVEGSVMDEIMVLIK